MLPFQSVRCLGKPTKPLTIADPFAPLLRSDRLIGNSALSYNLKLLQSSRFSMPEARPT